MLNVSANDFVAQFLTLLSYLVEPSPENQRKLTQVLALLSDYCDTLA